MFKRFSAERIVVRRKRLGKTQAMISMETGISQVSISAIEKGRKQPRSETLARLSFALECPVDSFFE